MSDANPPDPGKAMGTAIGEFFRFFTSWLGTQSALAVFAISVLVFVVVAAYWGICQLREQVPLHIDKLNAGFKAVTDAHAEVEKANRAAEADQQSKALAAIKEEGTAYRSHLSEESKAWRTQMKEVIDAFREDRRPIAVNPLGGS